MPDRADPLPLHRGINLGGVLDRRDGRLGWEVRARHLDAIVAAGFDTVRLPVSWWNRGSAELLEIVGELVDGAWSRGLSVVLTMHHADAVYRDPAGSSARLAALWRRIAARFAGPGGPLAFEHALVR